MKDYELNADEVVLYKGDVSYEEREGNTYLYLTNRNLVLVTKLKKLFSEEKTSLDVFPVSEIKIYEEKPQIKIEKNKVEIYFTNTEVTFAFSDLVELYKFTTSANKLLTGKSAMERVAEKVKSGIELVNDTLGIDVVADTTNAVKGGLFGKVSSMVGNVFGKKKK